MRRRREDEDGNQEIAELAALADGSLAPGRRGELEARVAASSELADRLAEQQRAVALPGVLRTRSRRRRLCESASRRNDEFAAGGASWVPPVGAAATAVLAVAVGLSVLQLGNIA